MQESMNVKNAVRSFFIVVLVSLFVSLPMGLDNNQMMIVGAIDTAGDRQLSEELLEKELRFKQLQLDKLYEAIGLDSLDSDASLEEKLQLILDDKRLDGFITGVSVRDASSGEELFEHFSQFLLRPASNMKLLTGAAALEVLGSDYTFTTEVLTDGKQDKDQLKGNLYLKGGGDPTLLKEDFIQFAKDLKDEGIKEITGNIIADDTRYDDVYLSRDITWTDEQYYYAAPVSALTVSPNDDYDTGTVLVEVKPGKSIGDEAEISLYPDNSVITVKNETTTVENGGIQSVHIDRRHDSNEVVLEGDIPVGSTGFREWRTVMDPTEYALNVFVHTLEEEGIRLSQEHKEKVEETPADVTSLTSKASIPLKEIMTTFMKLSNNSHGDLLVKELGKTIHDEGSFEKGLEVVASVLEDFGADTKMIQLRDGSGMSDNTLIRPTALSNILYAFQEADWYATFEESLPVAGVDDRLVGGTLRYRMVDGATNGNVKGKTGSLTGVSTLSGYVTTTDEVDLTFSILMNNYIFGSMTQIQDILLKVIAEHEF